MNKDCQNKLNPSHEFYMLAEMIDWDHYEKEFGSFYKDFHLDVYNNLLKLTYLERELHFPVLVTLWLERLPPKEQVALSSRATDVLLFNALRLGKS